MLNAHIDYSENDSIEEAKQRQGEHWKTTSVTLFMVVYTYLDWSSWDSTDSHLARSDEVTVNGEAAGEGDINQPSYHAVVIEHLDSGRVRVKATATGKEEEHGRSALRHRKLVTVSHCGITGDGRHDTYSMRSFMEKSLQSLHDDGTIEQQHLTRFFIFSDNAAQHFKSKYSLHWATLRKETAARVGEDSGLFKSVYWCFGCPGHGKDVHDGLGGVLKNHVHAVQIKFVGFNPNDRDDENPIKSK